MLRAIWNIGSRIKKRICGYPLVATLLGNMTLDVDDVNVAQEWLRRRDEWLDDSVTHQYQAKFAAWNGCKYAFAFMAGRVALSAAIDALGLTSGDEVIIPGYTCIVVDNALVNVGVRVVYSDIELDTYGLDAAAISEKITPKTKAILLQHLYGLVCRDYEAIVKIARDHGLKIIEDCAHATGAEYKGKKVGNLGDIAFYSSEQSKVFNTIWGGMVTTNDDSLGKKLEEIYSRAPFPDEDRIRRQLRNVRLNFYKFKHPQRWWLGEVIDVIYGRNYCESTTPEEEKGGKPVTSSCKMPSPIAALGLNQVGKIDRYNARRREIAKRWVTWSEDRGYKTPLVIDGSTPVFLRYPVLVEEEKKSNVSWAFKELGIELGVWFVSNLHPSDKVVNGCCNADLAVKQTINFPCLDVKHE